MHVLDSFLPVLLLALRSGSCCISSMITASGPHSLPVFRFPSEKGSGDLRRLRAIGANFGAYYILARVREARPEDHLR